MFSVFQGFSIRGTDQPCPTSYGFVSYWSTSIVWYNHFCSLSRRVRGDGVHEGDASGHPYRTGYSSFSILVHLDVRSRSGAAPPVATGCPLISAISLTGASADQDWSGTGASPLFSPWMRSSFAFFGHCIISPCHPIRLPRLFPIPPNAGVIR